MKVCVIGAGPSGLTTIKQLRDEGHSVVCFDKNEDIGGIWYRKFDPNTDAEEMKVYDNLILTISRKLMCYSDFMVEGDRVFFTHKQYKQYLDSYAEKYGLREFIQLKSSVNDVRKEPDGKWTVIVTVDGQTTEHQFDAVAVCSGPFQNPDVSSVPDIDKFSGTVMHSSKYRNNAQFVGKRVLIVGLAESGADVTREISDVASEAMLSIRTYSFLLPRLFGGTYATDALTERCHHYEVYVRSVKDAFPMKAFFGENILHKITFMFFAWIYGLTELCWQSLFRKKVRDLPAQEKNLLGEPMYPLKLDIGCESNDANIDAIDKWNARINDGKGNWTQKCLFSKNVSFIPNIVSGKLKVNDSGIERIEGNRVFFKNKESGEYDIIVLCTGFLKNFSAMGRDLTVKDDNVRNLYKHAFHPAHGGRLAFIGYTRPQSGGIPIVAEMQARYFAQLCSNKIKLPDDVEKKIEEEKIWEDNMIAYSPRQNETVASQIFLIDSMAKEIGCLMPLSQLIFRPKLFVRHWFYPYNQLCYRLIGPHNMHDYAIKELMADKSGVTAYLRFRLKGLGLLLLPHFIHPKYTYIKTLEDDLKSNGMVKTNES